MKELIKKFERIGEDCTEEHDHGFGINMTQIATQSAEEAKVISIAFAKWLNDNDYVHIFGTPNILCSAPRKAMKATKVFDTFLKDYYATK